MKPQELEHSQGPAHAAVQLREYGDFECSFCGRAYPIVKELQKQFEGELRLIFNHFPLRKQHPHAEQAAEAAEAAGAQGKFWEMHDLIFENQDALEYADLLRYAGILGLDIERFGKDLKTHRFSEAVSKDLKRGIREGVIGTPTFFINGQRYDSAHEFNPLRDAIQRAIDEQIIRLAI